MKLTRARKRIILEITVVALVASALALMLFFTKMPETRTIAWQNPNTISSAALIESPKKFNEKGIDFIGEAIGESMTRDRGTSREGAWVHLNDDAYMYRAVDAGASLSGYNSGMPVWVTPAALAKEIKNYGGYNHNGDVVKVQGVFHAACKQHGGDMDIHATSLQVVATGLPIVHPVPHWKMLVALAMALLALAMWIVNKRKFIREQLGNFSGNGRS